jgi:hypothetical protein
MRYYPTGLVDPVKQLIGRFINKPEQEKTEEPSNSSSGQE